MGRADLHARPARVRLALERRARCGELAEVRLAPRRPLLHLGDAACPISTGGGTRRVRLVRGEGRGVSG